MKVLSLPYKDECSIGGNNLKDLELGCKHNMVGGSYYVKDAKPGDIVCIKAGNYVQLVRIKERLNNCSLWKDNGGPIIWEHNFSFTALTGIFKKDSTIIDFINKKCLTSGIATNSKWFFHPRYHNQGQGWVEVVNMLVDFVRLLSIKKETAELLSKNIITDINSIRPVDILNRQFC